MGFWEDYLREPPTEVRFPGHQNSNPDDYHCVRWRGYEGGLEIDELWQFGGNGIRGKTGGLHSAALPNMAVKRSVGYRLSLVGICTDHVGGPLSQAVILMNRPT